MTSNHPKKEALTRAASEGYTALLEGKVVLSADARELARLVHLQGAPRGRGKRLLGFARSGGSVRCSTLELSIRLRLTTKVDWALDRVKTACEALAQAGILSYGTGGWAVSHGTGLAEVAGAA